MQLISPIPIGGLIIQQNKFTNPFVFVNMPSTPKLYKYFEINTHSLFYSILNFPCSFLNVCAPCSVSLMSFKLPKVRDFLLVCFSVITSIIVYSSTQSTQTDWGDHTLPEEIGPQITFPLGLNVTKCDNQVLKAVCSNSHWQGWDNKMNLQLLKVWVLFIFVKYLQVFWAEKMLAQGSIMFFLCHLRTSHGLQVVLSASSQWDILFNYSSYGSKLRCWQPGQHLREIRRQRKSYCKT